MHLKLADTVETRIKAAIVQQLPDAEVEVRGSGGHFNIKVVSSQFAGKTLLAKQRLVLSAIAPLMNGADAPVHAVDSLQTLTPG